MIIVPPFHTEHLDRFRRPSAIHAGRENSGRDQAAVNAGPVVEHTDDVSG